MVSDLSRIRTAPHRRFVPCLFPFSRCYDAVAPPIGGACISFVSFLHVFGRTVMSTSAPVRTPATDMVTLMRWIATKNPFYAVSVALVLFGLWISFGSQDDAV